MKKATKTTKVAKATRTKKNTSKKIKKSVASKRVRKVLQVDVLDKILLEMAKKPYSKIIGQIELGKKRLNEERRLALQLGTRILSKAKKVRDSLMNSAKSSRS